MVMMDHMVAHLEAMWVHHMGVMMLMSVMLIRLWFPLLIFVNIKVLLVHLISPFRFEIIYDMRPKDL